MGFADAAMLVPIEEADAHHALPADDAVAAPPDGYPLQRLRAYDAALLAVGIILIRRPCYIHDLVVVGGAFLASGSTVPVALSVAVVVKIYYSDDDMTALRHLHLHPLGMRLILLFFHNNRMDRRAQQNKPAAYIDIYTAPTSRWTFDS
jgi:hypothetical protein